MASNSEKEREGLRDRVMDRHSEKESEGVRGIVRWTEMVK